MLTFHSHQYITHDNQSWWHEIISKFPQTFQIPCNILLTERIPPFPQPVRNLIIDNYCPELLKPSLKISEPDQDCLIRPYLGRRRRRFERPSRFQAFSLRNYPLHVDQIEELGLPGTVYASLMAETLANLYWRANIDANDIEFVLAPPPPNGRPTTKLEDRSSHSTTIDSYNLGPHMVWILDFDCCRHMPSNEVGVKQAVTAFYRNDPFYPRPGRDNVGGQILWDGFKTRFLEVSQGMLGQGSPEAQLPLLWVALVEQQGRS